MNNNETTNKMLCFILYTHTICLPIHTILFVHIFLPFSCVLRWLFFLSVVYRHPSRPVCFFFFHFVLVLVFGLFSSIPHNLNALLASTPEMRFIQYCSLDFPAKSAVLKQNRFADNIHIHTQTIHLLWFLSLFFFSLHISAWLSKSYFFGHYFHSTKTFSRQQ